MHKSDSKRDTIEKWKYCDQAWLRISDHDYIVGVGTRCSGITRRLSSTGFWTLDLSAFPSIFTSPWESHFIDSCNLVTSFDLTQHRISRDFCQWSVFLSFFQKFWHIVVLHDLFGLQRVEEKQFRLRHSMLLFFVMSGHCTWYKQMCDICKFLSILP